MRRGPAQRLRSGPGSGRGAAGGQRRPLRDAERGRAVPEAAPPAARCPPPSASGAPRAAICRLPAPRRSYPGRPSPSRAGQGTAGQGRAKRLYGD